MSRLAILGAGSWGTALAIALATRFERVGLWARDPEQAHAIEERRENRRYLPKFLLPPTVQITCELAEAAGGADVILVAVPSSKLRAVAARLRQHLDRECLLVSATKGIEEGTLSRMTAVLDEECLSTLRHSSTALSGPTFAAEIAAGEPAAVVVASTESTVAETIQRSFATPNLRLYASTDVIGVETGAALKNVIAIGAGVCRGLGLGSNSVAALVTRGLAEITRLAVSLGGQAQTLSGLAGLGDLVLTATGDLSRNRHVGEQLGKGHALPDILAKMTSVAEGVKTCRTAHELARRQSVDMPIVARMYELLYEGKAPPQAIRELMERPLTSE